MIPARGCEPIQIGLVTEVPLRIAGFTSMFDQSTQPGLPRLLPIAGSVEEHLANHALNYLIIDLECSSGGQTSLAEIHRLRPDVSLIVIGQDGNDDPVMEAILIGVRGYLNWNAGPEEVRVAVDLINSGLISAPSRLLSRLVDRLMRDSELFFVNAGSHLTDREHQVLELILDAQSNREIARQLGIEERTVRFSCGSIDAEGGSRKSD